MSARLRPQIRSDNFWRASSAIAVLVGVVVLFGWGSDIEWLGGFIGTVRMKANTAASFALLGLALALLAPAHIGPRLRD